MAITRTDETELLTVLHEGMHERPRWSTFLDRLRRRTRADYVSLIFAQGDVPMHRATESFAGRDVRAAAERLDDLAMLDPIPYRRLRPGRVYSADELIDPQDSRHDRFRRDYLERIGVRYGRFMRVAEPGGASLWAILSRETSDLTAADGALLTALAPHLAIALRSFALLERERFRADVAQDALSRAGVAWVALDDDAHVVAAAPDAPPLPRLAASAAAQPATMRLFPPDAGPPIDVLTVPAPAPPLAAITMPVVVALTRRPMPLGARHAAALVALHQLTASEARLALLLAEGRTIAEAATDLRLTLETTRNYTKRIFSKTGTRGQAQLVRLILTGVAVLA